jgi:hypothetical protein
MAAQRDPEHRGYANPRDAALAALVLPAVDHERLNELLERQDGDAISALLQNTGAGGDVPTLRLLKERHLERFYFALAEWSGRDGRRVRATQSAVRENDGRWYAKGGGSGGSGARSGPLGFGWGLHGGPGQLFISIHPSGADAEAVVRVRGSSPDGPVDEDTVDYGVALLIVDGTLQHGVGIDLVNAVGEVMHTDVIRAQG